MIAGRFRWRPPGAGNPRQGRSGGVRFLDGHAAADRSGFEAPRLAAPGARRQRARPRSIRGGLEVLTSSLEAFARAITGENHTLKRALTDPHLLSGIGNAYSDEILHAARLSPLQLTSRLTADQLASLHHHRFTC